MNGTMAPAKKSLGKKTGTAVAKKTAGKVAKAAPVKAAAKPAKAAPAKKASPAKASKKAAAPVADELDTALIVSKMRELSNELNKLAAQLAGSAVEAADEAADDSEEGADVAARRAELEGMTSRALRALAKKSFEKAEVDEASDEELVDNLLAVEFGDGDEDEDDDASDAEGDDDEDDESDEEGDEDDEEDDDEDEDAGEDEYTREDLIGMGLSDLKNLAVELEKAESKAALKGMDKDSIADLILGDEEGDDEDEDGEEGEGEAYTPEELEEMSPAELKAILDEVGAQYKKTAKKEALIEMILNWEEDDEDE